MHAGVPSSRVSNGSEATQGKYLPETRRADVEAGSTSGAGNKPEGFVDGRKAVASRASRPEVNTNSRVLSTASRLMARTFSR